MKELSIEEKARAYDEAIKRAKKKQEQSNGMILKKWLWDIFPELEESEDEEIKKEIIYHIQHCDDTIDEETEKKMIAWFDKQESVKEIVERYKNSWYNEGKIQGQIEGLSDDEKYQQGWHDALEKQDEQKSVDKVKPKFKVGDWVINRTDATIMQIINNTNFYESIEIGGQRRTDTYNYVEWNFRLWTINDAKDGDILVTPLEKNYVSPFIAIYKKHRFDYFTSYCFIGSDRKFYIGDTGHDMIGIHPATKEQHDILFQKMEEAGYKWDPMTLKLNKEVIEDKKEISDEQNLSEEDKERIQRIYTFLWKNRKGDTDTIYQIENDAEWLKNLNTKYSLIKRI